VRGDDAFVDDWVRRAVDNGYAAFAITVDTAAYSRRERDLARRFVKPWRQRATGHDFQSAFSWDHIKRFKDTHRIPLILKGIATGLLGVARWKELDASYLHHGAPVVAVPRVTSAFPLLDEPGY